MASYEDVEQSESIAEMRGVCSFEYNGTTIFVHGSVEEVARALSEERRAARWQPNVVEQEIQLSAQCFFVFQFKGHTWVTIIGRDHAVLDVLTSESAGQLSQDELQQRVEQARSLDLNETDARLLSDRLKTRAIYYGISDTACALGYCIYENGELLERLETGECYELLEWQSTLHDVSADAVEENIETWVDQLFRENDALEPSLSFAQWVGCVVHSPGQTFVTRDLEDALERVDFIAL